MRYKIGDVAKKIGVSVRSLRYLDQLGILSPCFREPNGNRFYSEDDINKLSYINLLQLAGFTLRETPDILNQNDVREDFEIQSRMLRNKGRYYQQLGELLEESCDSLTIQNATNFLKIFRSQLNEMSAAFHSEEVGEESGDEAHEEIIHLMRVFADTSKEHLHAYKKLVRNIPMLLNDSFFDSFIVMLRVYKSNAFKLDELDQIEKNFIKLKKSLASDIM